MHVCLESHSWLTAKVESAFHSKAYSVNFLMLENFVGDERFKILDFT